MAGRYPYETAGKGLWEKLRPEARRMRKAPTPAEDLLWQALRGNRLGLRFRRQHAIDRFIVDFVCLSAKLVVEVDGEVHETRSVEDAERDARLETAGYRILRYPNSRILTELDRVLHDIRGHLTP